jgi:hypothetical protein
VIVYEFYIEINDMTYKKKRPFRQNYVGIHNGFEDDESG